MCRGNLGVEPSRVPSPGCPSLRPAASALSHLTASSEFSPGAVGQTPGVCEMDKLKLKIPSSCSFPFLAAALMGRASQVALVVKKSPTSAGDLRDTGSIPGWGRSPGGGHGNPLQCSCLENPIDRGAWRATVHRTTTSQTQLKRLSTDSRPRGHLPAPSSSSLGCSVAVSSLGHQVRSPGTILTFPSSSTVAIWPSLLPHPTPTGLSLACPPTWTQPLPCSALSTALSPGWGVGGGVAGCSWASQDPRTPAQRGLGWLTLVLFFTSCWMDCVFIYLFFKIGNTSRICVSSLHRGHANLLCIVPILVYVLPKRALDCVFRWGWLPGPLLVPLHLGGRAVAGLQLKLCPGPD